MARVRAGKLNPTPHLHERHQRVVGRIARLVQAFAHVAKALRREPPRPLVDRREVPQLAPVDVPRHAETRVEHRVRQAHELVHRLVGDVVVAQDERASRFQHAVDRRHERREPRRLDVMQPDVAGHEVHAVALDVGLAQRRVIVERYVAAELAQAAALDDVRGRVGRRQVVDEEQRTVQAQVLAQLAHVAPGGADLHVPVDLAPLAEQLERLARHLLLLLGERRQRVEEIAQERLDGRQLLLQAPVDRLVVRAARARIADERVEAVLGIDAVDVLQEAVERILGPHVGINGQEIRAVGFRHRGFPGRCKGRRVVLVPQTVAQAELRIDPALQREVFARARIGAMELLVRRVRLIGQVIAAADGQHGIDQLARPYRDAVLRVVARALLVIDHESERLRRCPREQSPRVGKGVPDRHVEHVRAMPPEDLGHLRHEFVEALDGHEVLLQYVRAALARRRLELGRVVARLVVAPVHLGAQVEQGIDEVLAAPLAERRLRHRPEEIALEGIRAAGLLKAVRRRRGPERLRPGHRANPRKMRRIEVAVVEDCRGRVAHVLAKMRVIARRRHARGDALDALVQGEVELRLDDDAQPAVAADAPQKSSAFSLRLACTTSPLMSTSVIARTERTSGPCPT
jgi:hypothetical protein